MKKVIFLFFIIVLFCGCTTPQDQEAVADSTTASTQPDVIETKEPVPPFEKEKREILPLPDNFEITDTMEFVDSIMANYETLHFEELESDFETESMTMDKIDEGYLFTSIKVKQVMPYMNKFNKPIEDYFNTPDNNYAALVRFKSDAIDNLTFKASGIRLNFHDGIYPATDITRDEGIKMIDNDWNNYLYEPGEWAYVFLSTTKHGQIVCYIWGENDISDYNFFTAYNEASNSSGYTFDFAFEFAATVSGETAIISDIWLYSYEELKR